MKPLDVPKAGMSASELAARVTEALAVDDDKFASRVAEEVEALRDELADDGLRVVEGAVGQLIAQRLDLLGHPRREPVVVDRQRLGDPRREL